MGGGLGVAPGLLTPEREARPALRIQVREGEQVLPEMGRAVAPHGFPRWSAGWTMIETQPLSIESACPSFTEKEKESVPTYCGSGV